MAIENVLSWLSKHHPKGIDLSTFEGRFFAQKGVYVLKALGYKGVKKYNFSLYIKGPYCSELADDYYALNVKDPKEKWPPSSDIPEEYGKIINHAFEKDKEFLETVATLHSIYESNKGVSIEKIKAQCEYIKPKSKEYIEEAWKFLKENNIIVTLT